MKKIISVFMIILLLQSCGSIDSCEKDGCVKTVSSQKVIGDTNNVSCKLTSAELRKRRETVLTALKGKVKARKELPDGYSFRFENTDEVIDMLTDFVKSERQCCDFFNFSIAVKNDGSLWFDLTGPEGAKEMIGSELGL
jgi:hypothetical protein